MSKMVGKRNSGEKTWTVLQNKPALQATTDTQKNNRSVFQTSVQAG